MRLLPEMSAIWRGGDFTGDNRPIARVTVDRPRMRIYHKNMKSTYSIKESISSVVPTSAPFARYDTKHGREIDQYYASYIFQHPHYPIEVPNVRSVTWTRSIDQDVATCTITLINQRPLEVGERTTVKELDQIGYYTPMRGIASYSKSWGHTANEWQNLFLPDNIIRTYEGYGQDQTKCPEKDPNLALTGVWMIDRVKFNAKGDLTLECRDMGRLLLEHMIYKPVVPNDFYPLTFQNWDGKVYVGNSHPEASRSRAKLTIDDTSNTPWIGSGTVHGHKPAYAIDGNPGTYWLSIGNSAPSRRYAYEWVQCNTKGNTTISEVRFKTKRSGYNAFVSVYADGAWQGVKTIDYHEDGVGKNGSAIKYVKTRKVTSEGWQRVTFAPIKNVTKIRLTLGNLQYFSYGPYNYRAGIREIRAYGETRGKSKPRYKELTPGPAGSNPGRYSDFSDIVKLLLAWGGFYWPNGATLRNSDATTTNIPFPNGKNDSAVLYSKGRIWGDLQNTGTSGPTPISAEAFDKKSLMDGIKYIQEIVGFHFAIDESGGAVWRLPNIYNRGNWITLSTTSGRTSQMYTLDEKTTLTEFDVTLDSQNVREKIIISDSIGKYASAVRGYNPNPETKLRRIAAVTDKNFSSKDETRVMAELTAIRAMFDYRTTSATITGFPGIQIDDQVRITERVTEEGYIHYVRSITSTLDMETGSYTYQIETNWLGLDPKSRWLIPNDRATLSIDTKNYIETLTEELLPSFRKVAL